MRGQPPCSLPVTFKGGKSYPYSLEISHSSPFIVHSRCNCCSPRYSFLMAELVSNGFGYSTTPLKTPLLSSFESIKICPLCGLDHQGFHSIDLNHTSTLEHGRGRQIALAFEQPIQNLKSELPEESSPLCPPPPFRSVRRMRQPLRLSNSSVSSVHHGARSPPPISRTYSYPKGAGYDSEVIQLQGSSPNPLLSPIRLSSSEKGEEKSKWCAEEPQPETSLTVVRRPLDCGTSRENPGPRRQLLYGEALSTPEPRWLHRSKGSMELRNKANRLSLDVDRVSRLHDAPKVSALKPFNSEPSRREPRLWTNVPEDEDSIEEAVCLTAHTVQKPVTDSNSADDDRDIKSIQAPNDIHFASTSSNSTVTKNTTNLSESWRISILPRHAPSIARKPFRNRTRHQHCRKKQAKQRAPGIPQDPKQNDMDHDTPHIRHLYAVGHNHNETHSFPLCPQPPSDTNPLRTENPPTQRTNDLDPHLSRIICLPIPNTSALYHRPSDTPNSASSGPTPCPPPFSPPEPVHHLRRPTLLAPTHLLSTTAPNVVPPSTRSS